MCQRFLLFILLIVTYSSLYATNTKIEALIEQDNFIEAEKLIPAVSGADKNYYTALIASFRNDEKVAYDNILKAVELSPNNPNFLYQAASIISSTSTNIPRVISGKARSTKIIELTNRALKNNPTHKDAAFLLALTYKVLPWFYGGDNSKSEEVIAKFDKMDNNFANRCRLEIMVAEKDYDEAIKFGTGLIKNNSNYADYYRLVARSLFDSDKDDDAFRLLEKGISTSKNIRLMFNYSAKSISKNRNLEKAEEYLKLYLNSKIDILNGDPRHFLAAYKLSELYFNKKLYSEAKKYAELTLKLEPSYTNAKNMISKLK